MLNFIVQCRGNLTRSSYTVIAILFMGGCGGSTVTQTPPTVPPPIQPPLAADEAQTAQGVIKGSIEGGLRVFRGVRYAAAPIGNLRFKAPVAPAAFSGTMDATQFGSVCAQPANAGTSMVGEEDCLFLNIWSHDDDLTRPIIVFLHGGRANGVGGDSVTTEGTSLAQNGDVIVVTLNRRLGPLGYLALDELIQENPRSTAGNYATLDVIAALNWIQDNIASFNGDPLRVMLAGQSAGGGVVCNVLSAPEAAGLINSAALQSAGCRTPGVLNDQVGVVPRDDFAVVEHRELVTFLGCDAGGIVLECLRGFTVAEIVAAGEAVFADFIGVTDGVVLPTDVHQALANNVVGDIPFIIGSNANEANNIFGLNPVADDAEYRLTLEFIFDVPLSDDLYALYPTANFNSASDAFLALFGDLLFNCIAEQVAESAEAGAPVYFYQITRGFDNGSLAGMGAVHSIDVAQLFGTFDVWGYTPDARANDISTAMQNAWSGLVANPTTAPPYLVQGASAWPAYFDGNKQIVEFGDTTTIATVHRNGRCPALQAALLAN